MNSLSILVNALRVESHKESTVFCERLLDFLPKTSYS
uniref:Uncharacterized protein n=1 Tax=Lepeophtheirus salmonis TaxID=72036 RepID=A0A0K2UZB4_LEPSM